MRIKLLLWSTIILFCPSFGETEQTTIPRSPEQVKPLKAGDTVPSVSVNNESGEKIDLLKLVKSKPSILIFYRGGWCPYCNTHLGELNTIELELTGLGYQILAISPDKPAKISETRKKGEVGYTLLSDSKMEATKAFGLAFKVDDETVKLYKEQYKIDLEGDSGETHHLLPVPAAYVVSTSGNIKFSYSNPDYKVRVDVKDLLDAAKGAVGK